MKYRNKNINYVSHNINYVDMDNNANSSINIKEKNNNRESFNNKINSLENDIKNLRSDVVKLRKEQHINKTDVNNKDENLDQIVGDNNKNTDNDKITFEKLLNNLYENYDYTKKIEKKLKTEILINKKLHEILKNEKNHNKDTNKYYNDN